MGPHTAAPLAAKPRTKGETMTDTIKLNGTAVTLEWREGAGIGRAIHVVSTQELSDGIAPGPSDGEEFEIQQKRYKLGSHDYEEDDENTVCYAEIYECSDTGY